jgi:hypothetical protein
LLTKIKTFKVLYKIKMSFTCDLCDIDFSTKQRLNTHINSEKHKKLQIVFEKYRMKNDSEINELKNKLLKMNELENNFLQLNEKYKLLENNYKNLQDKSEEYKSIIEKCVSKSTTTNVINTNNNKNIYNNYLNYISSEPIDFKKMEYNLSKIINTKSIFYNDEDFNNHIIDNILRDENGKDKVLCTDINRKNFSYKDETSGELISDPELERLREQLRKGADIKTLKKELLEKLVKKYENTNIDPYVKFYNILKKLDFGKPFVEHIAKKTYIKSISRPLDTKYEIENNENEDI